MSVRQQAIADVKLCERVTARDGEDSVRHYMAAFKKTFAPLVKAALGTSIEHDDIESLEIDSAGDLYIRTSWVSMGCADGNTYILPAHIIDAADPLHAATVHHLKKQINDAQSYVAHKEAELERAERSLEELKNSLALVLEQNS